MFRSGYKSLLIILFLLAGTVNLAAYYYYPENQPPGPPPNYNPIDPGYFHGVPPLNELPPQEMTGYYVFFDSTESRWSILRMVPFGSPTYEQFHGSILVQLESEPQAGVNVWPEGFDLTVDYHRNDRWGWVKWPDSIAPNLYEIWWDITLSCPEPSVPCTRTIGFWRNHAGMGPQDDLVSDLLPIWLGTPDGTKSFLVADAETAAGILSWAFTPGKLDGISKLRAQLLAAKLSIASGADGSVIAEVIDLADAFLAEHDPYDWETLSNEEKQMVLGWKDILDSYNNGFIGPGHDDGSVVVDCINAECPPCVIGFSFSGCAFDFNLWGSSYNEIFDADLIYLGEQMTPLASIPGYSDTFEGIDDPYGHPFDCPEFADAGLAASSVFCLEPNLSNFTPTMMMGASYNVDGLLPPDDEFGGSRVYEGNGIQFSANDCGEQEPPVFDPPVGTLKPVVLCYGGMIYDTIVARSTDPERVITLTKLSGPGDFTSTPGYSPVYGYYAYAPASPGAFTVVFQAIDDLGATTVDSIVYEVSANQPPEITTADTTIFQCWSFDQVCLFVEAFDPEGDPLTFTLLSGPGSIDPTTGELCFTPGGEGAYPFEVEVADTCSADTAAFVVTVQLNHDPWIVPFDTIVSLCGIDTICFDVTAYDPDPGDSLEIIFVDGPGEFVQTGNGVGRHCFLPDSVDSARYVFYYAVTDECWRDEVSPAITPPVPPTDSIVVVVITDVPPVISCPEELQGAFLCGPDSVCIDIPVEPADAIVTVIEPGAVYENGQLCFYADTSGQYAYTLVAEGECGSDTCFVVTDVTVDTPPVLDCPPSDSVHICEPGNVSVPLGVSPPTAQLTIVPDAEYADGMLTFYAGEAGDYAFTVYAETDCGTDTCNFVITVTFDSPPEVSISDSTVLLCVLEEICIPFTYSDPDDNIKRVIIQPLVYKSAYDSLACFTPPYAGDFEIIVTVLDSCGLYTSDTATITVVLNEGPSVEVGDEMFNTCGPTDVCLPVTISDPDGNIDSVVVEEPAYYLPEKDAVCLPVTGPGNYDIVVTVYDACGVSATDTGTAEVLLDEAPQITCPQSDAIHLCGPDSVSVPLGVIPPSAVVNIDPPAEYEDGTLTFYAGEPGEYCFEVTAGNSCGSDTCNFCLTVTIDSPPVVTIADTAVFQCQLEGVCLPYSFYDADDNVVSVTISSLKASLDVEQTEGVVCFVPDRPGINELMITVTDSCGNTDVDTATVNVTLNQPPVGSMDYTTFRLCEPDVVCIPLVMDDVDGEIVSVEVMEPLYYDAENQQVCLPVEETGLYQLSAVIYDDCGASTIVSAIARVLMNITPQVIVPADTNIFQCDLSEICLEGFEFIDINRNLMSIEFTPDLGYYDNGRYCFNPDQAGEYCFVVRATDSCGAYDEDTVCVKVELGDDVAINCPEGPQTDFLCGPDTVCVDLPIVPVDAEIIVVEEGAVYENGQLCMYAEASGVYDYTVIAVGDCGADTCKVTFDVTVEEVPYIACPESQSKHLCEPDSIMIPIDYTPATAIIDVGPNAIYEDGMLKFYADTAGLYCFDITASNNCDTAECSFCVTVTMDSPPLVEVGGGDFNLCEPEEICLPVNITDPDNNIRDIVVMPEGFLLVDGSVCFTPDTAGTYVYTVTVTDTCEKVSADTGTVVVTVNQAPSVAVGDASFFLCEPGEICLPVEITDPEGTIDSVVVSEPAYYNPDDGTVCLTVDAPGSYEITVTVYDECGAMATDMGTATVTLNSDPVVILPADTSVFLCDIQELCFPVEFTDVDDNIVDITLSPGFTLVEGSACFTPDTSGTYMLISTVTDDCGATDVDTMMISVDLNQAPTVAVGDTTLFSCEPIEVCLPVAIDDPEEAIASIEVTPPWVYDVENGRVCLSVATSGNYEVMVTVRDTCGVETSGVGYAEVTVSTPPQVIAPPDTSVFTCDIGEVCLNGFEITDVEDNITTIEFIPDLGEYIEGTYCFTPDTAGTYCFIVRATDECGATDEDTVCVIYELGQDVAIVCPEGIQPVSLCRPDSVCKDISIDPASAEVIVIEPGAVYENGKLCFYAESEGQYTYTLVASGDCSADTCQVTFDVSLMGGPMVTCPPDTAIHLCEPDSISLPVGVIPASADVVVSPEGVYADGMFSFYAADAGEYCFEVIASNECGSDTCGFCVTVTLDSPPVVTIADSSLFLCDLEEICLPYDYSDPDDNVVRVEVSDKNRFTLTDGFVCFTPMGEGTEEIIITVTDSCGNSDVDTATVEITLNQKPFADVGDTSVFICDETEICVPVTASDPDGVVDSIVAVAPAYYDDVNKVVCLTATESGNHEAIVMVYDDCGAVTVDTGIITVRYNFAPLVVAPADTAVFICESTEICLDGLTVIDIDGNLDTVMFIPDIGTWDDTLYCFTPQEPGLYSIIIHATDTCGASGQDTVNIEVTWGEFVSLDCPEGPLSESICDPDTICFDVPVTPADAKVTVIGEGGYYNNGQLCFYADTTGAYTYTVIADGDCNSDTCEVTVNVTVGQTPVITCPEPDPVHLCGPDSVSVSVPVTPATAVVTVTPEASYSEGVLTFFAAKDGEYCFEVVATGDCGADTCNFCVTVTFDSPPVVTVGDSTLFQCTFEEICIPVDYSDPDDNIDTVIVEPSEFSLVDGVICFTPDAEGVHEVIVTVVDTCGLSASDTGTVNVSLNQGPSVSVADSTVFLCGTADICLDVVMSDPDGVIDSVVVIPPAYYDADNQRVCMSVEAEGAYEMIVTVYDDCGASATDTGTAVVTTNTGPTVSFGDFPDPMHLCDLSEVCLPITVSDAEDNVVSIVGSTTCGGEVVITEGQDFICWLPNTYGQCAVTVIVTDVCGESDTAVANVELIESPNPDPPCPNDTTVFACEVGEVCIDLGEVQPGSHIMVRPPSYVYMPATHELCWTADGDASDVVTVIDSTECGVDSCQFVLTTVMNHPPEISGTAPGDIEFCRYLDLCLDYTIADSDNNVASVRLETDCPGAALDVANSRVCIEITSALDCVLNVIVEDECGVADTLAMPIKAIPNQPPQISLPEIQTVVRCEDDDSPIEINDVCVTDPDYDDLTMVKDSGLGEFVFNDISHCGTLTFTPPSNDSVQYCFRFMATDNCDTVYETYCLNVLPALVCSTCVDIRIEDPGCVNSGQVADIDINATALNRIAAYDLLISYDASALSFLRANLGYDIDGWEYFTYRFGDLGNCEAPCPSGLIRLVAISDINNGPFHPPQDQLSPDGNIGSITFRVTNDLNFGGQHIPIEFFWMDCGDNSFSDPSGQYLYVDNIIYSPEGNIIWDESNDAVYPDHLRPAHVGAPDSCLVGDKFEPVRCVSLHNGELCITHPDSVDARGDINLNGVAYEIADVVVYTNYFISGLGAFRINQAGQIAASDVNADGMTLSIADLVYLIRVIIGDADPYPKPIVGGSPVVGSCRQMGQEARISLESEYDIGAALLILNCYGDLCGDPVLTEEAVGMEMKYGWLDGHLRILIYSLEPGGKIEAGNPELIRIPVPEGSRVELADMELADYSGRALTAEFESVVLPQKLELSQNYPNPFNPTTMFDLALPTASDYVVSIYNITGQVVRKWSGYAEAGYITFEWDSRDENGERVASGIYFYRAQAAGSEAIRKMILIK